MSQIIERIRVQRPLAYATTTLNTFGAHVFFSFLINYTRYTIQILTFTPKKQVKSTTPTQYYRAWKSFPFVLFFKITMGIKNSVTTKYHFLTSSINFLCSKSRNKFSLRSVQESLCANLKYSTDGAEFQTNVIEKNGK